MAVVSQFHQSVRVRSVVLQTSDPDMAPKTLKLIVNRPSLAFNDVEDADEKDFAQVIELSDVDVKEGRRVPLRFVRFQSVNSLHASRPPLWLHLSDEIFISVNQIFVASNQGGADETRIDALDLYGTPVE